MGQQIAMSLVFTNPYKRISIKFDLIPLNSTNISENSSGGQITGKRPENKKLSMDCEGSCTPMLVSLLESFFYEHHDKTI